MVVHGQLVEPAVCLSDLYDVFLLDIVRDTRQNLWTMIYSDSQRTPGKIGCKSNWASSINKVIIIIIIIIGHSDLQIV